MKISLAKLVRTPAFAIAVLAVVLSAYSFGQGVLKGRIIREPVHGRSLENSVTGESPDRNVSIYLPPDYDSSPSKRYPVVYLLHGITDTDQTWTRAWSSRNDGYATLQDVMDKGIAEGRFGAMIVVMPDQNTKSLGSFYVNSTVTGNWEDFTAKDLVAYVDGKYRTLARSENRGITGHSMGGYGALSIAMNHPDIFSVAYGMNPALIGWAADLTAESPGFASIYKFRTVEELMQSRELYTIAVVTVGQAFSPNPKKPPFYTDYPYEVVDGKLRPVEPGFSAWEARFLANQIKDKKSNLLKLRGIRFDSGYEDEFKFIPVNSRAFSAELTKNGIEHKFEEYNGDHRNRMWSRRGRLYNEVMPYFWLLLGPQPEM